MPLTLESFRETLHQSMKDKDVVRTSVYRMLIGEIERSKVALDESKVEKLIRKIIENNNETLEILNAKALTSNENVLKNKIIDESALLNAILPKTLTLKKIKSIIVCSELKEKLDTKNPEKPNKITKGEAIKLCMNYFKEKSLSVSGKDVTTAIEELNLL